MAFAMVHQGSVNVGEEVETGELVVFEESQDGIQFKAIGDSHLVVGSAIKHPHELTMGQYSVHTNRNSLQRGEQNIRNIGQDMRNQGLI